MFHGGFLSGNALRQSPKNACIGRKTGIKPIFISDCPNPAFVPSEFNFNKIRARERARSPSLR